MLPNADAFTTAIAGMLVLATSWAARGADKAIEWRADYDAARKEAAEKGRPLFLEFQTEDCFHCRSQVFTYRDNDDVEVETFNILADTAGDPAHTIVVGGHLDSVRRGPGINDNGSGVAAMIETARWMAETGVRPKNRVRFGGSWTLVNAHEVAVMSGQERGVRDCEVTSSRRVPTVPSLRGQTVAS